MSTLYTFHGYPTGLGFVVRQRKRQSISSRHLLLARTQTFAHLVVDLPANVDAIGSNWLNAVTIVCGLFFKICVTIYWGADDGVWIQAYIYVWNIRCKLRMEIVVCCGDTVLVFVL